MWYLFFTLHLILIRTSKTTIMENLLNCKGKRFRAVIQDKEVEGKIQVEEGCVYLCQDKKCGVGYEDRLGYKGS